VSLPGGRSVQANPADVATSTHPKAARLGYTTRYDPSMRTQLEGRPARPPIVRRAAAGLLLVVVAALAIHVVIGLVMTVFWIVVAVAAVAAVLWALNTIL
jgi:hypothetical protein